MGGLLIEVAVTGDMVTDQFTSMVAVKSNMIGRRRYYSPRSLCCPSPLISGFDANRRHRRRRRRRRPLLCTFVYSSPPDLFAISLIYMSALMAYPSSRVRPGYAKIVIVCL